MSLNTFAFSTFVLGLMIYNDLYSPYKTNFTSIYLYFFILSFASMQLVEYFLWKNMNNKKAIETISICGQLVVLLQPFVSLLMLKNQLLRWVMLLAYSVPASFVFLTSNKKYDTTVQNGHLKWNWLPVSDMMKLVWLFFITFSFIVNGHYNYVLVSMLLFGLTYWSYQKNGTASSLWCWSINLFMIYFAVVDCSSLPRTRCLLNFLCCLCKMNQTRKVDHTTRDLNKWYSKMFEKLGWLVLAEQDGTSDKMAHYKMTLNRLLQALKEKKVVDKDKKKDLAIMARNVEVLLEHVNKNF